MKRRKGMTFPKGQLVAIQRYRESDKAIPLETIPETIRQLKKEERAWDTLFWTEYEMFNLHTAISLNYMDERNAVRVRIRRLQEKAIRMREKRLAS